MTQDISISTVNHMQVEEAIVPQVKPSGWLLFIRYPNTMNWMYGYPDFDAGWTRDTIRWPYPLFKSKDEAMDKARKQLTNGGDVKLFKIDL